MHVIKTCPKCGGDLGMFTLISNPPIPARRCTRCGWYCHVKIPVPPHWDLIDRAELWVEINKICDRRDAGIITDLTCVQQILSALRHAPTIIPAQSITAEEEKNDK